MNSNALETMTSEELTSRLAELLRKEQLCIVEFLRHLAEMDRRRTYLDLAYPSLFEYCTRALRLTKGAAFRRTTAARLLARFPVVAAFLEDGRLCLTTLVLLRDVLTPENHLDVLARAAGKTEDEVKVLVVELQPRPEVKESIRQLPSLFTLAPPSSEPAMNREPAPVACTPPHAMPAPARPRIEPVSATRTSVKLTVGPEFMEELAEVKAALSHIVPDGNLEAVLRVCFQRTLESCARRRRGATKARRTRAAAAPVQERREAAISGAEIVSCAVRRAVSFGPKPESRYIPAEVRRRVWERDQGRCTFVGVQGKRCESRHQLEFDHERAFALGGEATFENLHLRCRPHNQHRARQQFGDEHMALFSRSG